MKFEGPVNYIKPEDSDSEEQFRHHRFEIKIDGEVVAAAEVDYRSKPIPLYQVSDLYTEEDLQGRGYGSAIMRQVEDFLVDRGKVGILVDNSIYTSETGKSFYLERGWVKIDALDRLVYNLPDTIDPMIFQNYETRGQEMYNDNRWEENRKQFLEKS